MTRIHPTRIGTLGLSVALAFTLSLTACSDTDKEGGDTASESDADADADADNSIGNPVGDPIVIEHATTAQTVEDNIVRHIDGLQASIEFLEDSGAVNNLVDLLFGDDDDDDEGDDDEGDEAEEEDEPMDIDLSELRDGMVEIMADRLLVESTSTLAEDGLSIFYATDPALLCDEEEEEDESEERRAERLEDEAECEDRLGDKYLGIRAMSDNDGDVNLTLTVGETPEDILTIQLHDDQISAIIDLPNIRQLVEVFVDPEDFELPNTMEGTLGVEVRQNDAAVYTARFAAMEDVNITPDAGQEKFSMHMSAADDPGSITFDGDNQTIEGALQIDTMDAAMPWQIIVDMFYDDEGSSEWICEEFCETDEETGAEECWEECWEEWTEAEEAPEVDEAFVLDMAGVHGALAYAASNDEFLLTNLGLGDDSTTIRVDDATIVTVDVNPDNGRSFDLTFEAPGDKDLGFIFSEDFALTVQMNWDLVSDVFDDLPTFMLDDAMGIRFADSANPTLYILDIEDDTQIKMASGQITLWADSMDDDVVINEGECFVGTDCEGDDCEDEEEDEDEHDLFGGIEGGSCDE